ncbi:MAG TPA: DegV family protein [Tepidiformaceae bacterium]|nr:DegV family protein [Tepidiformaceae bacterium]
MLAIQFDEPEARIKIVNPGVGSAGLASLLVTIANGGLGGLEEALDAIERLEPLCDTIFAPADTCWLRTSGRLSMIEERIGQLESDVPVVRVGTRITGVARASEDNFAASLASAAVRRAGPARHLNVTIAHAEAEERATKVEAAIREAASVASIETVPLLASIGAQLGPGAVGLGVAPAHCGEED